MSVYSEFVNSALRTRGGRAPKRSFVTQAFTGASLLRDGTFGIRTATAAAFAVGVPPVYVAAAATILNAGDDGLTKAVLSGSTTAMFAAAKRAEARAALVSAFRNASPADRVALGNVVGVDTIFDQVVVPALDAIVDKADATINSMMMMMPTGTTAETITTEIIATEIITPKKSNGKTVNGAGRPARPAAPVVVPISTH